MQVLFIKAMFSTKNKSFLRFQIGTHSPASYNYEDSCEQREEDERSREWLFGAEQTRFTAVGAGSVPLVRCGQCAPNTRPQGFSLGQRCHHAMPFSDHGSAPLCMCMYYVSALNIILFM